MYLFIQAAILSTSSWWVQELGQEFYVDCKEWKQRSWWDGEIPLKVKREDLKHMRSDIEKPTACQSEVLRR